MASCRYMTTSRGRPLLLLLLLLQRTAIIISIIIMTESHHYYKIPATRLNRIWISVHLRTVAYMLRTSIWWYSYVYFVYSCVQLLTSCGEEHVRCPHHGRSCRRPIAKVVTSAAEKRRVLCTWPVLQTRRFYRGVFFPACCYILGWHATALNFS